MCEQSCLDNCIYALGGFDSSNYQSSVERFDARIGSWHSGKFYENLWKQQSEIYISLKFLVCYREGAAVVWLQLTTFYTVLEEATVFSHFDSFNFNYRLFYFH